MIQVCFTIIISLIFSLNSLNPDYSRNSNINNISHSVQNDEDGFWWGVALRFLAKSVIKRTIKKGVKKVVKNRVARFGVNQVANYAVDSAFDELSNRTSASQKQMIVDHWQYEKSDSHFDNCPFCREVGDVVVRYAETCNIPEYQYNPYTQGNPQNNLYQGIINQIVQSGMRNSGYLQAYKNRVDSYCQMGLQLKILEYKEYVSRGKKRKADKKLKEIREHLVLCN